ncbi:DUF6542 domain-containing protein [Streptomyces glaucescens]|uniref:DUF6542 domain-containing protein n=1 Tax=Streptomyces glaucescens TaxID=1907 RepID=UPI00344C8DD6
MEQHRTRPPQPGPRRGVPAHLPPQAARGGVRTPRQPPQDVQGPRAPRIPPVRQARPAGQRRARPERPGRAPAPARQPASAPGRAIRRPPGPRLTGLGCGLFCAAVMLVLAFLDRLLFGASQLVYGVLFLPVCVLTAFWVRRGDLVSAPVVVPIAFLLGLLPLAGGDGLGARLMALFTALATQAGWLYGGTLLTGSIVTVRKLRLMARRAAAARVRPPVGT